MDKQVRDLDPTNQLTFLRVASVKHEVTNLFFKDKSEKSEFKFCFLCFTGASGSRKGICPHSSAEQTGRGGLEDLQVTENKSYLPKHF